MNGGSNRRKGPKMEARKAEALIIAVPVAAIAALIAWHLVAHAFLLSCGRAGIESWAWTIRPIVNALGIA